MDPMQRLRVGGHQKPGRGDVGPPVTSAGAGCTPRAPGHWLGAGCTARATIHRRLHPRRGPACPWGEGGTQGETGPAQSPKPPTVSRRARGLRLQGAHPRHPLQPKTVPHSQGLGGAVPSSAGEEARPPGRGVRAWVVRCPHLQERGPGCLVEGSRLGDTVPSPAGKARRPGQGVRTG